jgi:hypothetical protein
MLGHNFFGGNYSDFRGTNVKNNRRASAAATTHVIVDQGFMVPRKIFTTGHKHNAQPTNAPITYNQLPLCPRDIKTRIIINKRGPAKTADATILENMRTPFYPNA